MDVDFQFFIMVEVEDVQGWKAWIDRWLTNNLLV